MSQLLQILVTLSIAIFGSVLQQHSTVTISTTSTPRPSASVAPTLTVGQVVTLSGWIEGIAIDLPEGTSNPCPQCFIFIEEELPHQKFRLMIPMPPFPPGYKAGDKVIITGHIVQLASTAFMGLAVIQVESIRLKAISATQILTPTASQ
jgi:hypothetical protein